MPDIAELATDVSFSGLRSLHMLWVQPFLELEGTGTAFRLSDNCARRQKTLVRRVFDSVRDTGVQFCLLPEFSLPADMITETDDAVANDSWPRNSFFISGIAPISVDQFNRVGSLPNTRTSGAIPSGGAEYVNCFGAWIKTSAGQVRKVFQCKLRPSRPEQSTQGMYEGNTVYLFRTDVLSFCCLICFDCISLSIPDFVASLTENVADGQSKNLHLLIVLEHNDHPEHPEVIAFAERILMPETPKLNSGLGAAVAFVNSAHKTHGRAVHENFGRSSLCYVRRGNWTPCGDNGPINIVPGTFAMEHVGNTLLRARFREDGPCLHSFRYFIPSLLGASAGETKYPVDSARVQKLDAQGNGGQPEVVPPLRKVFFDWLSSAVIAADGRFGSNSAAVTHALSSALTTVVGLFQACPPDRLEQLMTLLLAAYVPPKHPAGFNPDLWQRSASNWVPDVHGQAILELASIGAVLGLFSMPDFTNCDHSHSCKLDEILLTVLDGNNQVQCFTILAKYRDWLTKTSWGQAIGKRNLLVISRPSFMPGSAAATEIPESYASPTNSELAGLPEGVQPKRDSILETTAKVYWVSATNLRGALGESTLENARQYVRRVLEPATMS